jgi:hypothetical protein
MKSILELIKLIYGSKALSKILGTRTNVIRLPDNELKQYTKSDLNIEAASDKLAQKAKADMKELLADYPRMNDAEKLIFEGNLRRLGNKLGVTEKGSAADVLEFGTGEKVSPEGIMSLTEKAGQKSPPTTLMGKLESRVKQLEASGEDLSKMKGQTYDEFMNDITQGQRTMIKLEDEGLVRATAREIIDKDIKSKKIKLPKEVEADFKQGGGEPIDVFRQFYGEDALEQLNSMVPDFRQMYSPREAAEAATKKFNFEFKADRPPGSISIEDAKKAEQEFGINKPKQNEVTEVTDITAKVYRNTDPDELINEYNKNLDLLSQVDEEGGTLIGYQQFQKLQNRNTEIEKILNSIGIKSADSPEGKKITEALIGKPKASVTELVTAEKIILDMKNMDPMDAMKEANKVLKREGKYKNLQEKDVERIMEDTNDFIFGRDIPEDPEGFAKGGAVSKGLDYLMGIERRGYANGDYAVQAGIKNYLGKQKTATVPIKWKSGKDHPDTELAYITKPEKDLLLKLDMHKSMPDGEPNIGPGGLISLNSGGDGGAGGGAGGSGGGGTDTGDMGSEAANNAATDAANASVGMGGGPTDTGDLGSEAANDAATAAGAASVGMGTFSPYSRPGMIATNIANYMSGNPATSIGLTALGTMIGVPGLGVMNAVNSVYGGGSSGSSTGSGQGEDGSGDGGDGRTPISSFDIALLTPDLLDSYNLAKNRDYRLFQSSNNPFYSLQRNPSGGINNVYTEFKKGGRVGFAEGGSMSKGLDYLSGVERRGYQEGTQTTPTEDFSDYLNRDTSSNILKDLYLKDIGITEKDGEPRLNILQKYLDFNKNIKNNTPLNEYVEGARSGLYSDYVDPYAEGFNLEKDYFKSPYNLSRLAIAYDPRSGKLAYYDKNEGPYGAYKYYSGDLVDQDFVDSFGLKRFDPKDEFGFSGFSTQAYGPTNEQETPTMGEPGGIITDGGLRYRINADGSRTLLDTATEQTTPTEDFSDYLNTTTINTNVQTAPTVAEQMISPEDALTPEIPSNNVLDQWKAHAEATQAMKGKTGLAAIPEYGFQTGYDFQSKFPNLDPRIGAGLASGYQVLTEGLGMFNPNNPNFLNPAAAYKTALSDATKNIEGIMAFDQNLMTPEQQENRNKYLKSVGQNIVQQRFPTYQQDLENYRQRQAAVDPNALRNRYLENLQNTSSQDINQFQSQLRSNLVPRENQPQGLDYLTGL